MPTSILHHSRPARITDYSLPKSDLNDLVLLLLDSLLAGSLLCLLRRHLEVCLFSKPFLELVGNGRQVEKHTSCSPTAQSYIARGRSVAKHKELTASMDDEEQEKSLSDSDEEVFEINDFTNATPWERYGNTVCGVA